MVSCHTWNRLYWHRVGQMKDTNCTNMEHELHYETDELSHKRDGVLEVGMHRIAYYIIAGFEVPL